MAAWGMELCEMQCKLARAQAGKAALERQTAHLFSQVCLAAGCFPDGAHLLKQLKAGTSANYGCKLVNWLCLAGCNIQADASTTGVCKRLNGSA